MVFHLYCVSQYHIMLYPVRARSPCQNKLILSLNVYIECKKQKNSNRVQRYLYSEGHLKKLQ
jgi:hypothetical protein